MSLEKIYGLTPPMVKKMVNNGDLSCAVVRNYEIYDHYLQYKAAHPNKNFREIYNDLADHFKLSASTVRQVISNLDKKS